ncbi:MAG: fimbrillin family protein, partial [Mucinivorans sp.]
MKRFLVFATVAAAIMSSCTKQYIDEAPNQGGSDAIGFSTYVGNASKGVAKSVFVMGDQFFVYGGQTGAANFDIAAPNNATWTYTGGLFPENGAKVSNYGSDIWRYENPQPWGDFKTTFFAFSPVPVAGGQTHGITMTKPAVNTIPTIDFVVKGGYPTASAISSPEANTARAENKKQVDLLWAFAADKSHVDKSVELNFKHALTQLNFSVRSLAPAGQMIRINTIAVKNVMTKATLALAHDDTQAPNKLGDLNYMGGWKTPTEVKNFPVNLKNSVAALIKDNDIHAINDADEALMM